MCQLVTTLDSAASLPQQIAVFTRELIIGYSEYCNGSVALASDLSLALLLSLAISAMI